MEAKDNIQRSPYNMNDELSFQHSAPRRTTRHDSCSADSYSRLSYCHSNDCTDIKNTVNMMVRDCLSKVDGTRFNELQAILENLVY